MKPWIVAAAVAFTALAALSLLTRSPQREALAARHFSPEEIARGRRFAQERRLLFWTSRAALLGLLSWLALSGAASRLAARCHALAGGRWWLAALLVGAAVFFAQQLVAFPWRLYGGLYHLRAWGLTERPLAGWLLDYAKGLALSAAIGGALLLGLYALMRAAPRGWWLAAALGSTLAGAFFAYLAPLWIAPLFNRFVPLRETAHAPLQPEIEALAAKAGLPLREVLVMDASRQGRHTNAYFTGFFGTRRIVLYDTLLSSHGAEETLSILGHEMGHWRRDHIVKGLALGGLGALAGFLLLQRLLEAAARDARFGLTSPSDAAGIPLLLLLSAAGGFASAPVQNAVSRAFEREADRDALLLYGHREAFLAAERRLARDNIADVAPSDFNVLMFATHPPVLERIALAEAGGS